MLPNTDLLISKYKNDEPVRAAIDYYAVSRERQPKNDETKASYLQKQLKLLGRSVGDDDMIRTLHLFAEAGLGTFEEKKRGRMESMMKWSEQIVPVARQVRSESQQAAGGGREAEDVVGSQLTPMGDDEAGTTAQRDDKTEAFYFPFRTGATWLIRLPRDTTPDDFYHLSSFFKGIADRRAADLQQ